MSSEYSYIGSELDVFYLARNWKAYWAAKIGPYLGADVLEVGAGIGANTELLCSRHQKRWVCLEPDEALLNVLSERIASHPCRRTIQTRCGTIASIPQAETFNTILYIDVLEHIEDDRGELDAASRLLRNGGFLVILSPAHQRLYSPFDRAIGHYRRYSKKTLSAVAPPSLAQQDLFYLDAVGLFASSANLLCLRQALPTSQQIKFWDRVLVPMSTRIDKWLQFGVGKTVIGCWQKKPV
jgi:SAM-dependent methyltransferase